jgi:hypothetical protein
MPASNHATQAVFRMPQTKSPDRLYVANGSYQSGSVTVYDRDAKGNAKPLQTIAGKETGMVQPTGIAVDAAGNIFVSDFFGGGSNEGAVFVYAAGANGNVQPVATITTNINLPSGVALDHAGNVYAANFEGGDVTVYAAGSYAPLRVIGAHDNLGYVEGVTLDTKGNTYIVNTNFSGVPPNNTSGDQVFIFAAGSDRLIRTIGGARTGLTDPEAIAASSSGEIFVTNYSLRGKAQILTFARGANGNVKPTRIIEGPQTRLTGPGIVLISQGNIVATNDGYVSGPSSITVYPRNSDGDVAPDRQLAGEATGLNNPVAVTFH